MRRQTLVLSIVVLIERKPRSHEAIAQEACGGTNLVAAKGADGVTDGQRLVTDAQLHAGPVHAGQEACPLSNPVDDRPVTVPAVLNLRMAIDHALAFVLMKQRVVREQR